MLNCSVSSIVALLNNTKVLDTIVGGITVDMVYKTIWPVAVINSPGHAVGLCHFTKKPAAFVSGVRMKRRQCFSSSIPLVPTPRCAALRVAATTFSKK